MTPERWQQIENLYHAALKVEASRRARYLDEACAGDADLRREVESLFAFATRAENFIESPAIEIAANLLTNDQSGSAVGRRIGPYEVLSLLASGGMGEVYLAEDSRLGRKAALKLLPEEFTQDLERVRRFEREARAASALNHPNILTIYDIGRIDGVQYIATEFIEGETLRQQMKSRMELDQVLDIGCQVAKALVAAHEAGIIHRDIKPENIMARRDGYVKVLDFGLAKLIESRTDVESPDVSKMTTAPGVVMGTVSYMSPEQARGQTLDARTDIFSFGVVLYEMITGYAPFAGQSTADVIMSILGKEPPLLARFSTEAPDGLQWIIGKALRKDREERYQTARDLLSDLKSLKHKLEFAEELERSVSSGELTSTSKPVIGGWLRRWRNGWRAKSALAVAAGVVLVAIWFLFWRPATVTRGVLSPLKNVSFTQLTYQSGPEYFPSLSPDGKSLLYASRAAGNWDIFLQRVGGRNPTNLTKDSSADDTQPAFSPDGERIAFRSERDGGGIYVMGATGESTIRVSDFGYNPAWSSDGEQILVATEKIPQPSTRPSKSKLWAVNASSGERRLISEDDALQPSCSPHGQRIAYWSRPSRVGQRDQIWTIPAGGGQGVAVPGGSTSDDVNPVWSPDGKYLYFSSTRGGSMNIWRAPIDEKSGALLGEPEAVTTIGAATSAQYFSFSSDGRRLAYVAQEEIRNLRKVTFDPSSGKVGGEPTLITRGSMQLWFPDPSPDDQWLTCYSMGNQRHVFILRTDGTDMRDLIDDANRYYWPRWSPDGKRIAFSSRRTGKYELWVINRDGSGLQQLTQDHESPGAHYSPWSPDGTRIAYSLHVPKNDCVIFEPGKAWAEQKLESLASPGDPSVAFEGWSFSPDGKKLAGIRHLPNGIHSGIGVYDLGLKTYDWFTDFGDWPLWLNDNRHLLFVSQGQILLLDTRTKKYQPVLTVTDEDVDIGSPGLSRDNRTIYFAYVAAEADIWLLNLE